ncbi:MAG: sugar phosphate isomerase/epimerase family protein [Planctomycetota bacterium]
MPTLRAIERMGFEAVEIGVSDARFRRKKALKFLKRSSLAVVSVHNVLSEGKVDPANRWGDWLASPDPAKRRKGLDATLQTLDHAEALGARAVVLHLGAPLFEDRGEKQQLLYRLGGGSPRVADELGVSIADVLAERQAVAPRYLDAACQSLAELLDYNSPVKLGVECRMGWHELPNLEELGLLLDRFPDPRVGYWHDVGHAVLRSAMGLEGRLEWLERHGDRTVGVHLHDVVSRGVRLLDHYPPGLGSVHFQPLARLVPRNALRVMEVSSRFIAEEVLMGRSCLEGMGL